MTPDDELSNRLTALTRDLVLIPSTDARFEERARCFQFVQNHLDALEHVELRSLESNGYTSLLALPNGHPDPAILLCGHLDVVEHPGLPDYRSTIDNGHIRGPGAGDMKGQLAILLELFRKLHTGHPGLSLGLAITSDEERGGEDGVRFLINEAGLRCGIVIIPDGGSLNDLTIEEKGILHLRVRAEGRAAHAARPWLGRNALELLTDGLAGLHAHFETLRPEGAIERGDHWFPTCALTRIETPNESINRVPGDAFATLDVRVPPPFTAESALALVRDKIGPGLEVEPIITAEPTHLDPDPLFVAVTEEITGDPVSLVQASGGSDARFFRAQGIPVNLSRPRVGNLHAHDEWIEIASMVTYYHICETYIQRKLGLEPSTS